MKISRFCDADAMGQAAAARGAELLKTAVADRGQANAVFATGASQFTMLDALVADSSLASAWPGIHGFHLDEYVGLSGTHPASFRKYLRERLVERVPFAAFHFINADVPDVAAECTRLDELISAHSIDVMFCGIGENGHLAFNDPPADFVVEKPYLIVELDEDCRKQQHGEGWFPTLDDVPKTAISMSIKQIMASSAIICTVPDERKAEAVRNAVEGAISPDVPASILQTHPHAELFLDDAAASRLATAD